MSRYNHRISERKWKSHWSYPPETNRHYLTAIVPSASDGLSLENARLLIFADFYRRLHQENIPSLHSTAVDETLIQQALDLGVHLHTEPALEYEFCVASRDYLHLVEIEAVGDLLACGRFLTDGPVADFLPDYGADALRLFFLFQGPPHRDYCLNLQALGGAYGFVQRLWRMAFDTAEGSHVVSVDSQIIETLRRDVHLRIQANKPHTALAAVMGFVKQHPVLPRDLMSQIMILMEPYTPFLSAEILDLLSTSWNAFDLE